MSSDAERPVAPDIAIDPAPDPAAIRRRLEEEQARLSGVRDGLQGDLSAESESGSLEELSDVDQHPADTGTETFNRERDLGIAESLDAELAEVAAALGRLDEGTYGRCEACGRPIPAERLDALPATRFCVEDAALASAEAAPGVAPLGRSEDSGLESPGRAL